MDLKEIRQNLLKPTKNTHTDSRLLLVFGALGAAIILATLWFAFSDARSRQATSRVTLQQQEAVDQLEKPVQALKRVMSDEQVQALAARAIAAPATVGDLKSYLNGRINEISEVRVFGSTPERSNSYGLGVAEQKID